MIHTGKTVDRHSAAANRHFIATNSGGNRHFIAIGHMGQETLAAAYRATSDPPSVPQLPSSTLNRVAHEICLLYVVQGGWHFREMNAG
jgi:hypothetical protein